MSTTLGRTLSVESLRQLHDKLSEQLNQPAQCSI
jgi:hypothetical protein